MQNLNEVTLTGRFTADPVLRTTTNGKKCCNFDIAVKRRLPKDATEEQKKHDADFVRCTAWNDRAESIAKNGKKGRLILVKGKYHTNTNEKDGKVYKNTEVWIDHYEFMDAKKKDDATAAPAATDAPATDVPL